MKARPYLFWSIVGIAYAIFYLFVGSDPFYGDAVAGNSRAAWNIYDSGFTTFLFPEHYDPGHPTLIPLLFAVLWRIFGPGLWISHLFQFLFSFGIVFFTIKIAKKEWGLRSAYFSAILLLITPLFVAQTAMLNTHLPLTFFFMWAVHSRWNNRHVQLSMAIGLMLLTHLQSIYLLAPWLLWDVFARRADVSVSKRIVDWARICAVPMFFFVLWVYYHWSQTGWALSSPDYAAHRGFPGIKRVLVNLVLSDWRIVDFGLVAVVLPLLYHWYKRKPLKSSGTLFLWVYIFNALAISITTGTGPMHRYFLPCLPLLFIWAGNYIEKTTYVKAAAVFLVLFSGHFWVYPGKTIGDATLAYRKVFTLLDQYYADYPDKKVYSYAPLGNPSKWTYLNEKYPDIQSLYLNALEKADVILKSNVSGDFSSSDARLLDSLFDYHSYQNGNIYLNVYVNKASNIELKGDQKRHPSSMENWIKDLKLRFKGDSGM
jgi:4-amino-4-deoxy-L-arabinose transferase-like glycosyltransferase